MQRVRIFQSALNDVKYAAGRPLTLGQFLKLSKTAQEKLKNMVQG